MDLWSFLAAYSVHQLVREETIPRKETTIRRQVWCFVERAAGNERFQYLVTACNGNKLSCAIATKTIYSRWGRWNILTSRNTSNTRNNLLSSCMLRKVRFLNSLYLVFVFYTYVVFISLSLCIYRSLKSALTICRTHTCKAKYQCRHISRAASRHSRYRRLKLRGDQARLVPTAVARVRSR